jgi:hypothetical protein
MQKDEIKDYVQSSLKNDPKLTQTLKEAALNKAKTGTIDLKEILYVA